MFKELVAALDTIQDRRAQVMWTLRAIMVALFALNGWVGYAWAEHLGWLNAETTKTEVVTTTIATEVGSKPKPKVTTGMGSSPEATPKPKRKQTAAASASAVPSSLALPSATPSSAPATSEPTPTPSQTPTPTATTQSPDTSESPTPGTTDGNNEPIIQDPVKVVIGIIE